MIYCTLDDKTAYPSTTEKIKVTYSNPYVEDSGQYTYDITFPMDIAQNRQVFGQVQRIDVGKRVADFDTCRLYAANRLVISGKGTVTSITPDKVKVQIVGGKSRIKYNARLEADYIDEIDYPTVALDTGLDTAKLAEFGYTSVWPVNSDMRFLPIDLTTANFVGQEGVAVLSPVNDETNQIVANRVSVIHDTSVTLNGQTVYGNHQFMLDLALQPYLFYILRKVLEHEGYTVKRNDFDCDPWNRLVIVSAAKTGQLKDALPHWTAYKLIDEVRKLLNATFIFDDAAKTVVIASTTELASTGTVAYDPEDDFSVEHEDDGLDSLSTSNIAYNFDSSENRDWRECITQDVMKQYDIKEYDSLRDLQTAEAAMTDREKRTTIFKAAGWYYIWAELPEDSYGLSDTETWQRTMCGQFNPVVRDIDSDSTQELNICPAAMYMRLDYDDGDTVSTEKWWRKMDAMEKLYIWIPSVTNEKEASVQDMEVDDDGDYYSTVQDAMQGSTDETTTSTDDDTRMPVAFVANCVVNWKSRDSTPYSSTLDDEDTRFRTPALYTDWRVWPLYHQGETASLSLEYSYDGTSRFPATTTVDAHNLQTIKFITDDIPDPSLVYIFRGKRYICQKVELSVSDDGISPEKTGYFYEAGQAAASSSASSGSGGHR